jgi:hypothetical protein
MSGIRRIVREGAQGGEESQPAAWAEAMTALAPGRRWLPARTWCPRAARRRRRRGRWVLAMNCDPKDRPLAALLLNHNIAKVSS